MRRVAVIACGLLVVVPRYYEEGEAAAGAASVYGGVNRRRRLDLYEDEQSDYESGEGCDAFDLPPARLAAPPAIGGGPGGSGGGGGGATATTGVPRVLVRAPPSRLARGPELYSEDEDSAGGGTGDAAAPSSSSWHRHQHLSHHLHQQAPPRPRRPVRGVDQLLQLDSEEEDDDELGLPPALSTPRSSRREDYRDLRDASPPLLHREHHYPRDYDSDRDLLPRQRRPLRGNADVDYDYEPRQPAPDEPSVERTTTRSSRTGPAASSSSRPNNQVSDSCSAFVIVGHAISTFLKFILLFDIIFKKLFFIDIIWILFLKDYLKIRKIRKRRR